jgi:hypothetical protein
VTTKRLRIVNVHASPGFRLRFWLSDGRTFERDFAEELSTGPMGPMKAPLRDPGFFARARYDPELETVTWPNGYDMDPSRLMIEGLAPIPGFTFNPPEWTGKPKLIAELWRLTKDGKLAYCVLQNHPTRKAEIRCHADGELREARAENDPLALFALADEWKAGFLGLGWTLPR